MFADRTGSIVMSPDAVANNLYDSNFCLLCAEVWK